MLRATVFPIERDGGKKEEEVQKKKREGKAR